MRIVEALAPPPRSPAAPSPTFSALITALASTELGWSGFRQFVLPTVLRCTSDSTALAAEPESVKAAPVVQGALSLLAVLAEAGQLDHLLTAVPTPQTTRWANNVSSALEKRLEHLSGALAGNYGASSQEQDAAPLLPTLQLLPLFPQHFRRFAPHLERIVVALFEQGLASPETARSTYLASPLNAAALLGAALTALADMIARSAKKETAIMTVVRTLFSRNALVLRTVEACSWHRTALPALAKLLETTRRQLNAADVPSPATLAPLLQQTIMSSDATLRLAALQLLSLSEDLSEMSSSTDKSRLMQRCLEVEQTPLTVERVRDRNVRLRAVARELLRMRASDTEEAPNDEVHQRAFRQDVVIRYIIGSLKLNFKPVWVESIKALEDLAARFPDEVWERSFAELSTGPEAAQSRTLPEAWSSSREAAMQEDVDEIDEDPGAQETQEDAEEEDEGEDKQFRDPQLAARRRLIVLHLNTAEGGKGVQFVVDENVTEVSILEKKRKFFQQFRTHAEFACLTIRQAQRPQGRLDTLNYHAQILKFYAEVHSLAEKHNAPLVAHFFDNVHSSSASQDEEDDDVDNLSNANKLSFAERRQRLCAYLDLFSKFSNPKALFRSAELHATFMELLAVGEPRVQRPALECLLCWKPPSIMPYAEYLRSLLDAAKFRDALVNFELSLEADVIQPAHRAELIPLVIRLLFGQMVSRRGRGTAGAGQAARKSAILAALAGCKTEELETLVELMLSTFQDVRPHFEEGDQRFVLHESAPQASTRRQAGFLSLLGEVLKHFGLALVPYWSSLLGVTLNFTHYANQLALSTPGPAGTPQRAIRQAGLKRIADFFRRPTDFDFSPYLPALFSSLISPRLPTLRTESVQSPSALLELFHVWSGRSDTIVNLAQGDNQLLVHLYACLATPSVKPVVISRILDIVERALAFAEDGSDEEGAVVRDTVVKPYVSALLASLTPLVQRSSGAAGNAIGRDELLKREISILASLAPYVTEASDATQLLSLLSPMMRKSNQLVNERTKTDLLQIFRDLLLLTPEFQDPNADIFVKRYELFSGLFATLRSRAARTTLVAAFSQFANVDPTLSRVAGLVQELNAFSAKRLDEPDFDRRLAAFDELNERGEVRLSAREWLPLLHNMLHFIQDSEELAIRSNAGTGLRQFLSVVAAAPEDGHLRGVFTKVVYVGLRKGVKSRSEQVRREVLTVLAAAVQQLGELPALEEMRGLLAGGDDEASFFNNIHHIQIHRRARALRRLGDQAEQGTLRSKIIADVFAPLVGHFLQTGSVELVDHNLVNEAIACLGRLAGQMQWSAYNALLWKYLRLANEKTAAEKVYVRTAMAILDHFHFAMDDNVELRPEQPEEDVAEAETAAEAAEVTEEEAAELEAIAKAQAQSAKIVDAVTGRLLPALMGYLEQKDETDDAVRLPIAVGVVRVVQCLPANVKQTHIAKLLSTLSNVLKSKAQETRDLARETMSKICVSLGPSYFARVVKEMRRALLRGPQLHVLAFTVHALLVHMMAAPEPLTALDQGVEDVVHVATEDIFGQTGEDRDAVEYKSKMREVRSSKSMDTFEQLAKIVVPHRMSTILLPLRDIMQQTETLKAMKAVEDVLRRVASGVNANVHFDPPAFLILCHTLVSRNAAFLQPAKLVKGNNGKGDKSLAGYKFAVQMKRQDAEKPGNKDHYARNAHRFVAFGLDLLVTAFRRGRFDFGKPDIISRIEPLVPIIGNTLYSSEVGVLNLGLKASAAILKIPLASLDATLPVFIKRIFSIVHQAGNAQSDIVQTALKTLSTILRERKAAEIKEKQLTELLGLILPDLEEPASQGTLFGLLRAIIARRFVVPEVYDVMDKVAEMLVTNQSAQVRELCRAVFLQFLLDYPQGKARLDNQLSFLAKNLSYVYESGRLSTMELLAAVFAKFSDDVLRKYTDMFFVALVMVLANDESAKCRESAAALLKTLIGLSDSEQLEKSMQMAHAWAGQRERTQLARVGIQVYGIFLEGSPETASTWMPRALSVVSDTLEASADELESIEQSAFSIFDADEDDNVDWQLTYQALQTLAKLYRTDPAPLAPRTARATWTAVRRLLLYPHKWVRTSACRLLGSLFAAVPAARPPSDAGADHPLSLEALVDTAKKLSLQLRSAVVDETLSLQIVKNLLYIGKSFALVRVDKTSTAAEVEVDGPEEESDSEDEEEGQAQEAERDDSSGVYENPLAWIFSKLSHQARSAHLARPNAGLQVSTRM